MNTYKWTRTYFRILNELIDLLKKSTMSYPVSERIKHATHGTVKPSDALILSGLLNKYKPKTILEVGTFLGFSTRWLCETSQEWNPKITTVDPNIRHRIFDNPRSFVERLNSKFYLNTLEIVTAFFGRYDDYIYDCYEKFEPKIDSTYVDNLIGDIKTITEDWGRKFDFIFIDGDHSYESAMNNFSIAVKLLNKNGCIVFHDALSWQGVNRAVKELESTYRGKAKVKIYGKFDRILLKIFFGRSNDGIGFFKLKDL